MLKQSYRVPRLIHSLSKKWIEKVAAREPKEYVPRDAPGEVRIFRKGHYKYPEPIVDDAERYVALGKTVMFLATCSYLIEPLKEVLKKRGLPFHNPYRRKREDWNPLQPRPLEDHPRPTPGRGPTATERVLAYLRPHRRSESTEWTAEDLSAWAPWLNSQDVLTPAALVTIKKSLVPGVVPLQVMEELFQEQALHQLMAAMSASTPFDALQWWMDNLKSAYRRRAQYPVQVVKQHGLSALEEVPKIIIGTGHSVKGGEADVVYLFPDLSPSGMRNWEGKRRDRDALIRLAYVMMTRARESLIICEPAGGEFMPIGALARTVERQPD